MSEQKWMPIKEFVETGFLQEVNRRLLHRCGLALTVQEGEGFMELFGVRDVRDDPEGIIFDESEPPDWRKRNRVNEALNARIAARFGIGLGDPYFPGGSGAGMQRCPEPGE